MKELKIQLQDLLDKGFYPTQYIIWGSASIVY